LCLSGCVLRVGPEKGKPQECSPGFVDQYHLKEAFYDDQSEQETITSPPADHFVSELQDMSPAISRAHAAPGTCLVLSSLGESERRAFLLHSPMDKGNGPTTVVSASAASRSKCAFHVRARANSGPASCQPNTSGDFLRTWSPCCSACCFPAAPSAPPRLPCDTWVCPSLKRSSKPSLPSWSKKWNSATAAH